MKIGGLFAKFRRKKLITTSFSKSNQWISFWTAGLNYDSRDVNIRKCNINEIVLLEREPTNINDKNAIHIKRNNGESLGYVGRNRALQLSRLLDQGVILPQAQVVALKCDLIDNIYGVKIAIGVDSKTYELLKPIRREIEFLFDKSDHGNLYLLLDCEESSLDEIIRLLSDSSIEIIRSGISYRTGRDGLLYSWYLRLDNEVDQKGIEKILRDNFPILQERYNQNIEEEYFDLQEEEIKDLKSKNELLKLNFQRAQKALEQYEKIQSQRSQEFENLLGLIIPNVNFLRDSLDLLQTEIQDYSDPIKKIFSILKDPGYKAKKVNTLKKWWELHFNTGQKDDGRLYFKRDGNGLRVLVSFKKNQKKDISYLKRY